MFFQSLKGHYQMKISIDKILFSSFDIIGITSLCRNNILGIIQKFLSNLVIGIMLQGISFPVCSQRSMSFIRTEIRIWTKFSFWNNLVCILAIWVLYAFVWKKIGKNQANGFKSYASELYKILSFISWNDSCCVI